MFCPECRSEFIEGVTRCPVCDVDLIDELGSEWKPEYIEYEQVLGTYNVADIAFIKSLLDSENITYYFNAEHFTYVRPLAEPARLMVKKDEVAIARTLLKGLKLAITGVNLGNDDDEMDND
ncbi:MAG: hypothetical protein SV775_12090 [Thermodesulfobacteriota bacterium]|nr:hypothetical protein [Thermodesulfobacteriota bacterium]